jgi:very-short-patch-repair endonuclease
MNNLDVDDIARRYLAGETQKGIAKSLGVSAQVVNRRLHKAGVQLRTAREVNRATCNCIPVDETVAVSMYSSGYSELAIARHFGVTRNLIRGALLGRGVTIRGRSDANLIRMAKMTAEERKVLTDAAHAAVRGIPKSEEEVMKTALGRERRQTHSSRYELQLAGMIEERGIPVRRQKAVGRYNVDIAIEESSVAVEVFGGHWHSHGVHAARYRQRCDYLLDRGWLPIIVWVTAAYPLRREAAHYIVAWHDARCFYKTPTRQEHVIRGNGDGGPIFRADHDGRPVVPSLESSLGPYGDGRSPR